MKLFQSNDDAIVLSSFQHAVDTHPSLLVGWKEDLLCGDRWKVLQHLFSSNLSRSFTVTLKHTTVFVPCKSCDACLNPIECSWYPAG